MGTLSIAAVTAIGIGVLAYYQGVKDGYREGYSIGHRKGYVFGLNVVRAYSESFKGKTWEGLTSFVKYSIKSEVD